MRLQHLFLAAAISVMGAGPAFAGAGTASGSGSFTSWAGYGYSYSASWSSSPVDFALSVNVDEHADPVAPARGVFSVELVLNQVGSSAAFDSLDVTGTFNLTLIDTATGLPAVPPGFTGLTFFGASVGSSPCGAASPVAVRFSTPTCSRTADLNGSGVGGASGTTVSLLSNIGTASFQYRSGHFLLPSSDPSCASFDCMIPGHDPVPSASLRMAVSAAAVDEPTTLAMMLAGAATVLAWTRRRNARRSLSC